MLLPFELSIVCTHVRACVLLCVCVWVCACVCVRARARSTSVCVSLSARRESKKLIMRDRQSQKVRSGTYRTRTGRDVALCQA